MFHAVGLVTAFVGIGIEGVAAVSMVSYPLRRRLPSPFAVGSIGFICYLIGVAINAFAWCF
jgi:hypothetical protein